MAATAPAATSPSPLSRSEQREQTRARILDAALAIIVDEGMRSIRHRAVAERAGVSLGSTTYHFSSIEELIISAFEHWRAGKTMEDNPYYRDIVGLLGPWEGTVVPPSRRKDVADEILQASVAYIYDQLTGTRDDRIIEMAFYHESMRYASLRAVVASMWQVQISFLEQVHFMMGSTQPEADAMITSSLFRQLEQSALMSGTTDVDINKIHRDLSRHMSLCFNAALPKE
jgi:TetR/AcrR family transcriptional regulator, regulator of biofilm formation and stress response